MSLNWKIQLSLDNRPRNPMPFLVISLLLHGAVLFGLENYWHQRKANQTLQTKAEELIPIKFLELPPEQVAVTPPVDTKQRASTNSRGGGEAPPKLPSATRALDASSARLLPSQKPSLTQAKSSTPPPSPPQPSKLPQQSPPAPPATPLSPTAGNQNASPPVAAAPPAPKVSASSSQPSRQNPRPVEGRPANSQPQSSPSAAPPAPKLSASSSQLLRPNPRPVESGLALNSQPQSSPSAAPPAPKLSASSSQLLRSNPRPGEGRPNSQPQSSPSAAPPAPKLSASSSQPSGQNASLLGGPVSLNSRDSTGEYGGNLANAGRIGTDSQGVDALKDANLGPYLDGLRQEVVQQWDPERPDSSKQTIVSFAINRTGEVNNLRILQSSGSTNLDQAALQAVQRSSPFNPLPRSYSKPLLNIHFKFNINVRGQLELTK